MPSDFVQPTFLGLGMPYDQSHVVLIGCPMDDTSSYRPGSRFGPKTIREASFAIETFSPVLKLDLEDVPLKDLGDLDLVIGRKDRAMEQIANASRQIMSDRKLLISLGGEHLIALPLIKGFKRMYPDLKVIQLDAHADLREEYQGESLSHATVMRRILDVVDSEHFFQMGIRSGTREEFALMDDMGSLYGYDKNDCLRLISNIGDAPCYISLDLDILDPGIFPATGVPEPGGMTFIQVIEILYHLKDLHVVGIDVTEFNPLLDPSGHCAVTAAKIIRELILLFARDNLTF